MNETWKCSLNAKSWSEQGLVKLYKTQNYYFLVKPKLNRGFDEILRPLTQYLSVLILFEYKIAKIYNHDCNSHLFQTSLFKTAKEEYACLWVSCPWVYQLL